MDGDGGNDTKTAIEVHFTPSYMFFPIHNSRMQKWLYRHVFTEGIGLRQLIDYYFVLVKSEERRVKNLTALQRELKYLGLWKFAGAVMYVLHEALGLPEAKMIAPIDVNEGLFCWLKSCKEAILANMTLDLEARRMKANFIAISE